MIPTPPPPRFALGTRLHVRQHVRVGHLVWTTDVAGEVVEERRRPIGGMEMGGKDAYIHQPTIHLRKPDGEITAVTIDDKSEVTVLQSGV